MQGDAQPLDHYLIWIYPDNLLKKLNAAPTLQITRGLRLAGWQVDLLMGGINGVGEIQGIEVIGISRPEKFMVKQLIYHIKAMKYVLDRWNTASVVFFLSISVPWMLLLRFAGLMKGKKRPLFVMDTRTMQMEKRTARDRLHGQFTILMNNLAIRFADGQTAITSRMADAFHIPPDKLWGTWPSGVDLLTFSKAAKGRRWPKGNDVIKVVYVGTLAPGRDLMPLCQAIEKANDMSMCFELSLIGDGPDRDRLASFAAHAEGRVRLLGRLNHEQIPALLKEMHVGVLPFPDGQEFRVSSPIKLFEYMGAGLSILATHIACHTDVIGDRPFAFWAEDSSMDGLTKALRSVWENRFSLADRGQMAGEAAKEYTWAASAKKLSTALEYGLEKHRRKGS